MALALDGVLVCLPYISQKTETNNQVEKILLSLWEGATALDSDHEATSRWRFNREVCADLCELVSGTTGPWIDGHCAQKWPIEKIRDVLNERLEDPEPISAADRIGYELWKSFAVELVARQQLIECRHCQGYALFWRDKQYCSKRDGQDCLKRATNAKEYRVHHDDRLKKKKAWINKARQEIPGY